MNLRIFSFLAILAVLIGIPAYSYFDNVRSGGKRVKADGTIEVDLKAMSSFAFDNDNGQIGDVPKQWRDLDGKKVELIGEMYDANGSAYANNFSLVYSIAKCCFSGPQQIQHFVKTSTPDNSPIPILSGPVRVTGTLRVNVVRDEASNKIDSVYQLELEKIDRV